MLEVCPMTNADIRNILADNSAPGLRRLILETHCFQDAVDAMQAVRRRTLEEFGLTERHGARPLPGHAEPEPNDEV